MLLTATVRLALEQFEEDTTVVLRVPGREADAWRQTMGEAVQVVGDEELRDGACVLETSVGRIEMGVAVQLEEIEKGFFDLLAKRPA